jgi:membrane protein YdbS with pleckstrin-like domain
MPDPFLFIVGIIAIACVVLFPIRLWRRRRHRYGTDDDEDDGESPW